MVGGDEGHTGGSSERDVDPGEVLDRVRDGLLALDDEGRVTYANGRAAAFAGVDADELVGRDVSEALPSLAEPAFADAFERAMERQERVEFEAYHEPHGASIEVHLHPSSSGVTARVRDVTARNDGEQTARHEAHRLRTVVESMDDVATIKDRDGRYQLVNAAGANALGRSREDVLGRTDEELFGPEVGRRVREREREVLDTEEASTYRHALPTADGDRLYETVCTPHYGPGGGLAGTVDICRDVTERETRERELRRYETLVETSPDAMFVLDDDLSVTLVNDATEELTGYDRETMVGEHVSTLNEWGLFDDDDFEDAMEQVRRLLDPDGPAYVKFEMEQYDADGEPWNAEYHVASIPGDGDAGVVGVVRDITGHVRQQRRIRRQCGEIDTLNRINGVVHEIIDGLLDATSRDEIESTVCERLAGSDLYENAWIAERDDDGVAVRAGVGDDAYFEAVESADVSDGGVNVTLSANEALVIDDLATDDRVPEPVRDEAGSRGYRSVIVVPLAHGSATYGALVVNANRRDAFSDRERSAFELLGETVGFAVNAAQNRRLLLGDNLVEFTFRVTDSDAFFFRIADRLDCTCTLEWMVPGEDDSVLLYVSVADADPDEVLALADAHEHVRDVRTLGKGDDGTLFEVAVSGSAASALFESGAKPTEYVAESGSARITIEAPPSVDIETVVDAFEASESDTELVAKRDVGRSTRTASEFREAVGAELTDRQRSVLRAAHHAGYFDWPRDSTAEDLAETLDVSSATVHYHLRRAQDALVDAFLRE